MRGTVARDLVRQVTVGRVTKVRRTKARFNPIPHSFDSQKFESGAITLGLVPEDPIYAVVTPRQRDSISFKVRPRSFALAEQMLRLFVIPGIKRSHLLEYLRL